MNLILIFYAYYDVLQLHTFSIDLERERDRLNGLTNFPTVIKIVSWCRNHDSPQY